MKHGFFKSLIFSLSCFSVLTLVAAGETKKILLPMHTISLEDLNPQITEINNAFFLISDAIKNSNSDKLLLLLESQDNKKVFLHKNLDSNQANEIAQTGQANAHKREKLRELLNIAIENQSDSQPLIKILELFSENKKLNPQDKLELYKDAKAIYSCAKQVIAQIKEIYYKLFNISENLKYEHQKQLEKSLNQQLFNCVQTLQKLCGTFALNKYSDICHEYENFDLTIWKLYKNTKQLDYELRPLNSWNNIETEIFAKSIGEYVEPEYSFDKKLSDFADLAKNWIAKGILGTAIAGSIFLTWYLNQQFATN